MREPTLSSALFAILSSLVEERTGIHHGPQDLEIFSSKLVARAIEAGFESPLDYYYFLRYDDPGGREFDALVDSLVVNETYFFREEKPLVILCEDAIRPAVAAGRRPRIWCAACSTGEEPLTLAMLLEERSLLDRVEIVASDISLRALARASGGVYGARSLRVIADASRQRWMEKADGGVTVKQELRDAVTWRRLNLADASAVAALGKFDVIVCRNVLIYFAEATVRRVIGSMSAALEDGGRLLVGVSESLLRFGTLLACEERGGAFYYRKVSA